MSESPAQPGGPQAKAALSRELADFLIELSIALHKHAMYPADHPSLAPAADRVLQRLSRALAERATLSLGVARQQLVIEGIATDPKNPVLRELAGRLHSHHIGAVTFQQGVRLEDLLRTLTLLATDADRSGAPLGLGPRERLTVSPYVRLYPLSYERLELLEEEPGSGPETDEGREERTRAAQLWIGLARAALAADTEQPAPQSPADGEAEPPIDDPSAGESTDPSSVARAIESHPRGTAYDQVIVGYLLQIAEEVKSGVSPEDAQLQRRVSELINHIEPQTLGRLLDMGGDRAQRRQFLLNATDALAVDAVIELVRAAGDMQHETISNSMLRMLQKLALHTRGASERRRSIAETSVREQVAELVRGWSLADPNPDAYRAALGRMASSDPVLVAPTGRQYAAEPERIVRMAVEIGVMGPAVQDAARLLVRRGELSTLADVLADEDRRDVADRVWGEVANVDTVRDLLARNPPDLDQLDLILPRVGLSAAGVLLDALSASESAQVRRWLLGRIVRLGSEVGASVAARLDHAHWYVQRNMLTILGELPELPTRFSAIPFLDHPDARVRREALRLSLRDPATRERAVCRALTDSDERILRYGLGAALEDCPEAAIPIAASLALRGPTEELRIAAIRVLGRAHGSAAIEPLLSLVSQARRSGLFRRRGARSAEQRAALQALNAFADHPRVQQVLAQLGDA